ncbi:MAG: dipicolinate synthase subunit DpsA [Microbacterium sp.]
MSLQGVTIAVVGGDEREQEIVRLAASEGAQVRAHGFPWPDEGIPGVTHASAATAAMEGAQYVLFPVPSLGADGSLFAPASPNLIVPDEQLLGVLAPEAHVILGTADERLSATATRMGIGLHEYERDRELMLLRAPAIVEGAIGLAIEHTDVTIHAAHVAVVGHGMIGSLLARGLHALGARVHVAARNPAQRAEARVAGAFALPTHELPGLAPDLAMIFSTVPASVVGREVLERLRRGSLVVDLAAPPGGIDLEIARALGHRAVWARGLGRRAPITVGASQWLGIKLRIEAIEGAR